MRDNIWPTPAAELSPLLMIAPVVDFVASRRFCIAQMDVEHARKWLTSSRI